MPGWQSRSGTSFPKMTTAPFVIAFEQCVNSPLSCRPQSGGGAITSTGRACQVLCYHDRGCARVECYHDRVACRASRFARAANVLSAIGVFPPARHLRPSAAPPEDACNRNHTTPTSVGGRAHVWASHTPAGVEKLGLAYRGVLSLSATHAAAWAQIVAENATAAVFEDDVEVRALIRPFSVAP